MIRSTFAGFTMAQMALSATQRAIDVAGQNLSNVNTAGYTRQRLDLASISPVGASYSSSVFDCKVGQGVMMKGISQIRDPFLDIQYRNQITKVGTADSMDQILARIGEIFDETDKSAISASLNDVISQLKNLAYPTNAGESSSDTLVRSSFEVLLSAIRQNATALDDLEAEVISKFEDSIIPNINTCLKEITEYNKTIKNSQVLGNPALELQDKRNQLLDDLATYLPIKVSYTTSTGSGEKVDILNVTFKDSDGNVHTLISDDKSAEFQFDASGGIPVSLKILDALHPAGAPTQNTVSDVDVSGLVQNGVLKGNLDMLNKQEAFDGSDTRGIGYYRNVFDGLVNQIAQVMNTLNGANGPLFEKITPDADPANPTPFTATNIKVSDGWMNGTVSILKGSGGTGESTAYENVTKMINALSTDSYEFKTSAGGTVFKGTIQAYYDHLQNVQAIERKATSSILDNHTTVLNQIADSRDSVSGVNQDEEVMDLMRYQQSYNAASRLMTTLDQLLDKLINETGVVGR